MGADEAAMLTAIRAEPTFAGRLATMASCSHQATGPTSWSKAIKSNRPDGTTVLLGQQRATATTLQMHGRLKSSAALNRFDHVAYLAGRQRAKGSAGDD